MIKPDEDGDRIVSDAQHVAVKRALEGLQRKGLIIGFRDTHNRGEHSDIELCHVWMTEEGLARWLAALRADVPMIALFNPAYAAEVTADLDAIAARARAMGMKV
jgi:hypothetical protein